MPANSKRGHAKINLSVLEVCIRLSFHTSQSSWQAILTAPLRVREGRMLPFYRGVTEELAPVLGQAVTLDQGRAKNDRSNFQSLNIICRDVTDFCFPLAAQEATEALPLAWGGKGAVCTPRRSTEEQGFELRSSKS